MKPQTELLIPEITFKTSRSGGKGGQNVNKVSTKVELNFDVSGSKILSEEQKAVLLMKLSSRITSEGILQIVSQSERSQLKNKKLVIARFYALIDTAFYVQKKRRPTQIPRSVIEKRLKNKKRTSEIKRLRRREE